MHRSITAIRAKRRGLFPSAPSMAAPQRILCGSYGNAVESRAMASSSLEKSLSQSQRLFRFGTIRVMAATALGRENLKLIRPQPQPPRFLQQRRKVRGGAKFSGQGWRIHCAPKMPQNGCGVNVFRNGNSGFAFVRHLVTFPS